MSQRHDGLKRRLKQGQCHCLQDLDPPGYWRLNLQPERKGNRFDKYWHDPRELKPELLRDQHSLKTILSPSGTRLSALACMSLSVMLAHSLFYVIGQPWVEGRWNQQNIVFFGDGSNIPLRPFLRASHQSTPRNSGNHRCPDFLELAVMLLEINFQRSLEAILGVEREIKAANDRFACASQVYSSQSFSQLGLEQAVLACLSVSAEQLDEDDAGMADIERLRKSLLEEVVRPLEEDLEQAYGSLIETRCLDEEAAAKIWLPYPAAPDLMAESGGVETPRPRWPLARDQLLPGLVMSPELRCTEPSLFSIDPNVNG